jgi:hypothetical protein
MKKVLLCALSLLIATLPAMAQGGSDAGGAASGKSGKVNMKGAKITIGAWWGDYDTSTYKPTTKLDEQTLDWRKQVEKTLN